MKIFLLPGQSIKNREWIEEVEKEFKKEFSNTEIIYYTHWNTGKENTDVDVEVGRFVDSVNGYDGEYIVFAKSIGCLIFLKSIEMLKRKPKGVLMVGMAYKMGMMMGYDFKKLGEDIDFNINIYQKKLDPAGSVEEVREISTKYINVQEYEVNDEPNDNHHYANLQYILDLIKKF
jgi:predicted alpha/beta hydrolase family esterase